jgi:glutathione S-transferase
LLSGGSLLGCDLREPALGSGHRGEAHRRLRRARCNGGHLAEREYFVGERFTIADIALYAYTHVAPEGGFELDPYPAVRGWLGRVAAQAGMIPITA